VNIDFTRHTQRLGAVAVIALTVASFNMLAATKPVVTNPTPSVAPVAAVTTEDIRDIRGPRHIPEPVNWAAWLLGGAALAALGFAAWRWARRRALAAKLPYELALDRLEKVRALMRPESAREFSFAVSEIVRGYTEQRFHVWAARRTTEEFLRDLLTPSDALLGGHRTLLADFLHHCDLAKFARWILSHDEMETMYRSAHTFVLETGRPSAAATPTVSKAAA
jgi:hypothetical protein